jgi:hypothetical protein
MLEPSPRLDDIHIIVSEKLERLFPLNPVNLKHPLPERSARALGLIKIDGKAFSSKELLRALILNINISYIRGVRTIFLGPRIDLGLPIFSAEIILMGKKRMFFLDIQRRGGYDRHNDTELYDRLVAIKGAFSDLFAKPLHHTGEIKQIFSRAACYMNTSRDQDEQAIKLLHAYLDVFIAMVQQAPLLTGTALEQARRDYDAYTKTVVDHDPAAKVYRILFGKAGGAERVLDLFFAC